MNFSLLSIRRVQLYPNRLQPVEKYSKSKPRCHKTNQIENSSHSLGHIQSVNSVKCLHCPSLYAYRIYEKFTFFSPVWDEPYAVGLLPNGVEVRCVFDASGSMKDTFIQSLPEIQRARHLVRSKKGTIFAASITQLYCIQAVNIQKQCQSLLQQKKFQLALQLTVSGEMIDWNELWFL